MLDRTGRFGRSERLLRSSEYQDVAAQGRRAVSSAFVLLVARRGEAGCPSRLGITASRRVGNAVARNRIKRRIREWFRRERRGLRSPMDVLVIARRPAATLEFDELCGGLSTLLTQAVLES